MVQRESKIISSYKAPAFDSSSKSQTGAYKKSSPFDFKGEQDRKSMTKGGSNDRKTQDAWGKVFKNEAHFKSLHIC